MKKYLLLILILLMPTGAWGTTWFAGAGDTDFNAVSGTTISSVWNDNADGTSGNYLDWSTQPANGDIFVANGATVAIDDNIGSGSVTVTLTTEGSAVGGTDGGGFTMDIGTNAGKTLYVNTGKATPEGTTDILTITDAADASNGTLTIIGNTYGTATANKSGILCNAADTDARITYTGNMTGGSANGAYGMWAAGNGCIVTQTGNLTGGSNTSTVGAYFGAGNLTVIGNLIASATSAPYGGLVRWTPTAPSDGAGHYFKVDGGGTALYVGKVTNEDAAAIAAKVATGEYFIYPSSGTSTVGTASSGGGASAW